MNVRTVLAFGALSHQAYALLPYFYTVDGRGTQARCRICCGCVSTRLRILYPHHLNTT